MTAILQVVQPDKYGVWNGTSARALKSLGVWPTFDNKDGFGGRYVKVNEVLLRLAADLGLDLWTLDGAWWGLEDFGGEIPPFRDKIPPENDGQDLGVGDREQQRYDPAPASFGLERHLQDFLVDNWGKTPTLKDWSILEEDGDTTGVEYNAGKAGKIDLLARNVEKRKWLVVELKKGQTSDETVGQVLRYMGWVEENLAKGEEVVEGIIIAEAADEKLRLALRNT
ncbi:MAG: endonuclease NucS domain-containing protein, partial [Bryobacteraceae bacterium]